MIFLRKISFFCLLYVYCTLTYAHLEPPFTLTQKIQDTAERIRNKNHLLKSVVCYQTDSLFEKILGKSYEMDYDPNGNLQKIVYYRSTQQPTQMIFLEYDQHSNMMKQKIVDTLIQENQYATYQYDNAGRVVSYTTYTYEGEYLARFQYTRYVADTTIVLTKFDSSGTLLYTIHYKMLDDLDGLIDCATKVTQNSNEKDFVKYQYDSNGHLSCKQVYRNDQFLFQWEYQYDSNGNEVCVQKVHADGKIETKIINHFNQENQKVTSTHFFNHSPTRYFRYEYDYYPSNQQK